MYTPKYSKPAVLSVSQLNFYLKSLIENDPRLQTVFIEGEISNLAGRRQSGHIYFSLKDAKSVIGAVIFAGNARRLVFAPENGMKVICRGRVSLYEPSGRYQIIIEDMQPQGAGSLAIAFEQLKKRLQAQGLFSPEAKKPIPRFPKRIGVITSPSGAAVQDIRNIISRRNPGKIKLILCPVLVQGETAPPQMINALQKLNDYSLCDVIIIGRGGGSMEDLWAFNSEQLAYAVYQSKIPVISAVGHETDFTICDFVADLRAPTPSAAAELAVPDKRQLENQVQSILRRFSAAAETFKKNKMRELEVYSGRAYNAAQRYVLDRTEKRLSQSSAALNTAKEAMLNGFEKQLIEIKSRLEGSNPQKLLERGLAVVEKDGKAVKSISQLKKDDKITIRLADGEAGAVVTDV